MSATIARTNGRKTWKAKQGILLDLGCGPAKQSQSVGMDIRAFPGVDVVHDWNLFPWPFESESVLTLFAINVVEHVNPADGHFLRWMDECWRLLKVGGQIAIVTPYAGSQLYFSDPTHCNPCNHMTFWYFDPAVRVPWAGGDKSLYRTYEPAPWEIQQVFYKTHGMMELALRKREDSGDYHADGEVHYR